MFAFPIFVSLAAVALSLIISILLLRFALMRLLAFDIAQYLEPRVSISQQCEATGSETASPTPPYLASSVDDDELIGGDPIHLSPLRGPAGVTLTFRVFTPPSFDKEIPKVDLYGVINFVRTGKVRTFVPRGSLRLLVINLREMTLAVYAPKQVKKKKQNKAQSRKDQDSTTTTAGGKLFSDDGNAVRPTKKSLRRASGILCSAGNMMNADNEEDDDPDTVEVSEDAWNPRHFEPAPAMLHRLNDLVSVAAVPPRHGGVIEIMSRLGTLPCQKSNGEDPFEDSERKNLQNAKPNKPKGNERRPVSPRKQKQQTLQRTEVREEKLYSNKSEKSQHGSVGNDCRLDYIELASPSSSPCIETGIGTTASTKDKNRINDSTIEDHRDEYAFRTACDAAEFQRIIMVLRTVGREITYLYETLEANPDEKRRVNETAHIFISPGVVLDDAWHCLQEIPSLRKGLYQFQLLSRFKEGLDDIFGSNRNEILEAADLDVDKMDKIFLKEDWTQDHHEQRKLLGLVDFFSLFVPPLSKKDSHAIPCFTPCAKTESMMFERDPDLMLTRGIEWHYQRLSFVSALQRRVSKAALYVRAYASARIISHDGWHLHKARLDEGDERDGPNSQTSDEVSNRDKSQNVIGESLFRDTRAQTANVGEDVDAIDSEPVTISDSSLWCPPLVNSHHQGYSCVGWYTFRSPPLNEHPYNRTGKSKVSLCPDSDPLDCIPSLRAVVTKYPYAHFFICSLDSLHTGITVYFLLVRSLPVGVDRAFDDTVHNFVCSCAKERDQRLGISLQLGPGNGSSLLTRVTFRAILIALCHELARVAMKFHPRKEQKSHMILLSEFLATNLASLWHYGGSLQKRDDLPMNYVAINSQFFLNKIPSRIGRGVLGRFVVDFTCVLKTFSKNLIPERAITSIRMVNIDLKYVTTAKVFKEAPGVKNGESRIRANNVASARTNLLQFNNADDNSCNLKATIDAIHNTDEIYCNKIDTIHELLDGMSVPLRKRGLTRGEHNQDNRGEIITIEQIHFRLTRSDIERYLIACECDLKATVVRLVESAAWRGIMFPVDGRSCRIEMQSAQFFQQGFDKDKNAIFYFRDMLLGPWRNDIHATVLSVLHRLETYLLKVDHERPSAKVTVIAFMGHPIENEHGQIKVKKNVKNRDVVEDEQSASTPPSSIDSDPRIDPYEEYHTHSNFVLLQLLNELIPRYYPGRLAKALVVPSKGWAKSRLRTHFASQFAQSHVTVLSSGDDLKKYVDKDELVMFAGGNAKVTSDAFECGGS